MTEVKKDAGRANGRTANNPAARRYRNLSVIGAPAVGRVRAGKSFLVFGDGRLTAFKPIGEADLTGFLVDCREPPDLKNRIPR